MPGSGVVVLRTVVAAEDFLVVATHRPAPVASLAHGESRVAGARRELGRDDRRAAQQRGGREEDQPGAARTDAAVCVERTWHQSILTLPAPMDRQARRRRGEAAAHLVLVVAALALRLLELADKPFQYDEGQIAYFSWTVSEEGSWHYQPVLHGPFQFYATGLMFALLGDSDFSARLLPALFGTALTALPFAIRRQLGSVAALGAATLLCVSPSFLYFSRFAREDIWMAFLTLALFVVALRFASGPRPWHLPTLGALLALSFATKESTYATVAITVAFLVGAGVARVPLHLGVLSRRSWLALGVASFALLYALLYSDFLRHPAGLVDGLYEGPRYWLEQHPVGRGGEPWYFYLVVLITNEWFVLALGAIGIVRAVRSGRPLWLFVAWFFLAALGAYSYAGERFAWLVLNPLLPLVLLGGLGLEALWEMRGRWARPVALAVTAVGLAGTAASAIVTSFARPTEASELLVVVQTQSEVEPIRDEIVARGRRGATIAVDTGDSNQFPWAWYLRGLKAGYADMSQPGFRPDADILLVSSTGRVALGEALDGYRGRRFEVREFWGRDYRRLTPTRYFSWLFEREPWSPLGTTPQWVYVRREAGPPS